MQEIYMQRGSNHQEKFAILNRVRHFRAREVDQLFQNLAQIEEALNQAADSLCHDTVMPLVQFLRHMQATTS
jgi:hypothetical protein